jgi:hypothetical protein
MRNRGSLLEASLIITVAAIFVTFIAISSLALMVNILPMAPVATPEHPKR